MEMELGEFDADGRVGEEMEETVETMVNQSWLLARQVIGIGMFFVVFG